MIYYLYNFIHGIIEGARNIHSFVPCCIFLAPPNYKGSYSVYINLLLILVNCEIEKMIPELYLITLKGIIWRNTNKKQRTKNEAVADLSVYVLF